MTSPIRQPPHRPGRHPAPGQHRLGGPGHEDHGPVGPAPGGARALPRPRGQHPGRRRRRRAGRRPRASPTWTRPWPTATWCWAPAPAAGTCPLPEMSPREAARRPGRGRGRRAGGPAVRPRAHRAGERGAAALPRLGGHPDRPGLQLAQPGRRGAGAGLRTAPGQPGRGRRRRCPRAGRCRRWRPSRPPRPTSSSATSPISTRPCTRSTSTRASRPKW